MSYICIFISKAQSITGECLSVVSTQHRQHDVSYVLYAFIYEQYFRTAERNISLSNTASSLADMFTFFHYIYMRAALPLVYSRVLND